MGEIDLSVASILALGSAMLGWSYAKGAPIWLAIIICLVVGTVCGFINGFLVTKVGLGSLAVTIGTLALYRGIANGILGENTVNEFPEAYTSFGFDTFGTSFMPKTMPLIIFFGLCFAIEVPEGYKYIRSIAEYSKDPKLRNAIVKAVDNVMTNYPINSSSPYYITDMTGRAVRSGVLSENTSIDISGLTNGTYVLNINEADAKYVATFIKN